jgi:dihydroneopterin aldolase/2-amino-4-hydroxy-6-hydroxymethyldihydropteridine diphosphokinase/dihydropteroate synthase
LILLKKIEVEVGRVPSFRNGPRAIDLDIILYDDLVVDSRAAGTDLTQDVPEGSIVVPHPRMAEREFVMRPVCEQVIRALPNYIY